MAVAARPMPFRGGAKMPFDRGHAYSQRAARRGGGGDWAAMNRQMAEGRAKRETGAPRSYGTAEWVREKGIEGNAGETAGSGTSIFDPVLSELAYRWFSPPGGLVLDPFAGGSVRGIVASKLGRQYVGIDLRAEQIAANRVQADAICGDPMPVWHEGDSRRVARIAGDIAADFVFSCPPYADLERYSNDNRDLSTLEYPEFISAYRKIIAASVGLLKADRFACFVVGDVRGKDGFYRGFPRDTIGSFEDAGARLYNEAVLVTAIGSLPIRVRKQFVQGRKLGKTHQNVLVFCKGSPRKATEAIGTVEVGNIEDIEEDARFGEPL